MSEPAVPKQKLLSKNKSIVALVAAIVGGIGGAIIVGHVVETSLRMVLGLSEMDLAAMTGWFALVTVLMIIGTLALAAAFFMPNKYMKWLTIAFSMPIPMVIEIVDLSIRGSNLINEYLALYS